MSDSKSTKGRAIVTFGRSYQALAAVPSLRKGRTMARETDPVQPVEEATVEETLPHLPSVVADMVRLQKLCGCRPQEVCSIRPFDVDRTGDVWLYRPTSHKTQHLGRQRVIAVGTTSVRILESAAAHGSIQPWEGDTDLFIRPGYSFRAIDGLITNFHLPKSTLLVLVRTFGGDQLMQQAYAAAIEEQYRFYSYGDAMLIL